MVLHIIFIMDTSDIVKRILQLKKVSIELRQTTQNLSEEGTDLIRGLLEMGKTKSNSQGTESPRFSTKKQDSFDTSIKQKTQNNKIKQIPFLEAILKKHSVNDQKQILNKSQLKQSNVQSQKSSDKVFQILANGMTKLTKKTYDTQSNLSSQQQIARVKQQNLELQCKLKKMQEQLNKLQQIQKLQAEQEWKDGLPYFTLNHPSLKIFCTKLNILEKDYNKIDYMLYSVTLSLEHLILNPTSIKNISSLQQNKNTSNPRGKKPIFLSLKNLKEVEYSSSREFKSPHKESLSSNFVKNVYEQKQFLIIYHFLCEEHSPTMIKTKPDEEVVIQTLFIKFENEQERDQWDLGVYINFKILENLGKDEIQSFSKNDKSIKSQQPNNKKTFSEMINKFKGGDKQDKTKMLGKKKQSEEVFTPFLKQPKGLQQNKTHLKFDKRNGDSSPENSPLKKKQDYSESNQSPEFTSTINYEPNDDDEVTERKKEKEKEETRKKEQIRKKEQAKRKEEETKKKQEEQEIRKKKEEQEMKEKRKIQQEKQIKQQKQKKEQIERNKQQEKKQEEENLKMKAKLQRETEITNAKASLKKGYILTKYAKGAYSPHEKRVYINTEEDKLCWRNKDQLQFKFVSLSEIAGASIGQIGQGIEKHLAQKIKQKKYFCVLNLTSKDRKKLEFGAKEVSIMENFCLDLNKYLGSILGNPPQPLF